MANDLLDLPATADAEREAFAHPQAEDAPAVPAVPAVPALADLIEAATTGDGGTSETAAVQSVPDDARPCFKVYDEWATLDTGRKLRPGVWRHAMSAPRSGEPAPVDTWVCGPLHIEAQTFDGTENNFGRLLRFKNTAGRWRT